MIICVLYFFILFLSGFTCYSNLRITCYSNLRIDFPVMLNDIIKVRFVHSFILVLQLWVYIWILPLVLVSVEDRKGLSIDGKSHFVLLFVLLINNGAMYAKTTRDGSEQWVNGKVRPSMQHVYILCMCLIIFH